MAAILTGTSPQDPDDVWELLHALSRNPRVKDLPDLVQPLEHDLRKAFRLPVWPTPEQGNPATLISNLVANPNSDAYPFNPPMDDLWKRHLTGQGRDNWAGLLEHGVLPHEDPTKYNPRRPPAKPPHPHGPAGEMTSRPSKHLWEDFSSPVLFEDFWQNYLKGVETGGDLRGGYNDRASDSGGPTKWGVSTNYNRGALHQLGVDDVKNLTEDQAKWIMYNKYYDPVDEDLPHPGRVRGALRPFFVDMAINGAPVSNAVARSGGDPHVLKQLRDDMYRAIAAAHPEKAENLPGWLNRDNTLLSYATDPRTPDLPKFVDWTFNLPTPKVPSLNIGTGRQQGAMPLWWYATLPKQMPQRFFDEIAGTDMFPNIQRANGMVPWEPTTLQDTNPIGALQPFKYQAVPMMP